MKKMRNMLRNTYLLLLVAVAGLAFSGCEREIPLDLDQGEPRIVIEGWVTTLPGPYEFRVSRSVEYLGSALSEQVGGARIVLSDDLGNVDTLVEQSPGVYHSTSIQGLQMHSYSVQVEVGNEVYKASNYLPRVGALDSVWTEYDPDFFFGAGHFVKCIADEPAGEGDYYQFRIWQNDSLYNSPSDLLLSDDRPVDGQKAEFQFPYAMEEGDTVVVEVRGISNISYDYYITLFQQLSGGGGPFGSPPENLLSNFDNGALGFFGCGASARDTIVVTP